MPYLFDSHAHLQDEAFEEDRDQVLLSLKEAGVGRVVLPASYLEDAREAVRLALDRPGLYVAIGVHPQEAFSYTPETSQALAKLYEEAEEAARARGRDRLVVAIGEIGLDYHYENAPREVQKEVYREQLGLAHRLGLPVVIHEREAFADSYAILQEAQRDGYLPSFVCHCFSGSQESADLLLAMGGYLGFDGPITFKNARKAPDIVADMPADRLLIETDSPYLSPEPLRGRRNDPSHLVHIAQKAADLRGMPYEALVELTWNNACRFFGLEPDPASNILLA